jgi:hypothetical protein
MADDVGLRGRAGHSSDRNLGRDNIAGPLYHSVVFTPIANRKTQEVPVLFFQAGDAKHLPYTFWQARHWAGNSPLILLGDEANRHYRGLEHVPIRDFASSVSRLRDSYVHMSSNTAEFELFCLSRWLVIEEFARRQGLREFLYLDSDVLLFESPASMQARLPLCRLAAPWDGRVEHEKTVVSPGTTWIRDGDVLSEIGESILSFYGHPAEVARVQSTLTEIIQKKQGGWSDMNFLTRYASAQGEAAVNLWNPYADSLVDLNISLGSGFRCRDGLKDIDFRDGQAYGFFEPTQRWVRFATLHFVGHTKKFMGRHLGRPGDFGLAWSVMNERIRKGLKKNQPLSF